MEAARPKATDACQPNPSARKSAKHASVVPAICTAPAPRMNLRRRQTVAVPAPGPREEHHHHAEFGKVHNVLSFFADKAQKERPIRMPPSR